MTAELSPEDAARQAPDERVLDFLDEVSGRWEWDGRYRKALIRRAITLSQTGGYRWSEVLIGTAAHVRGPSIHTEKQKMRREGLLPPSGSPGATLPGRRRTA